MASYQISILEENYQSLKLFGCVEIVTRHMGLESGTNVTVTSNLDCDMCGTRNGIRAILTKIERVAGEKGLTEVTICSRSSLN